MFLRHEKTCEELCRTVPRVGNEKTSSGCIMSPRLASTITSSRRKSWKRWENFRKNNSVFSRSDFSNLVDEPLVMSKRRAQEKQHGEEDAGVVAKSRPTRKLVASTSTRSSTLPSSQVGEFQSKLFNEHGETQLRWIRTRATRHVLKCGATNRDLLPFHNLL